MRPINTIDFTNFAGCRIAMTRNKRADDLIMTVIDLLPRPGKSLSVYVGRQTTRLCGPAAVLGDLSPNTAGSQQPAAAKGLGVRRHIVAPTSIRPSSSALVQSNEKDQISFGIDFGLLCLRPSANALAEIGPLAGALPLPTEVGAMCNSVAPSETNFCPATKSGRASFVAAYERQNTTRKSWIQLYPSFQQHPFSC